MKFAIFCCAVTLALGLGSNVDAQSGVKTNEQSPGMLSGLGLPNFGQLGQATSDAAKAEARSIRWPKFPSLFGSTQNAGSDANGLLETMPSLDLTKKPKFPESVQLGDRTSGGLLSGLPKLFGGQKSGNSNQPNVLDQFNSKSKNMIDRTTDWARGKQQKLREKTLGAFGGVANTPPAAKLQQPDVRPELNQPPAKPVKAAKPDYYAKPTAQRSAQPPIRTASNPDQPAVRF